MENTEKVIQGIRTALNSERIQSLFGEVFETMNEEKKVGFMIYCLVEVMKFDKEISKVVATDVYNEMRAH